MKTDFRNKNFFWFYHIFILIVALYGLIGAFALNLFSRTFFVVLGSILGISVLIVSIIAIVKFRKLSKLLLVLPIAQLAFYCISIPMNLTIATLTLQKKDASSIIQASIIIIFIYNLFRAGLSSYIIYKFKK